MTGLKLKIKGQDSIVETDARLEKDLVIDRELDKILGSENEDASSVEDSSKTQNTPKLRIASNNDEADAGNDKGPIRKKKRVNKYFYKVSNHHELFKIGRSFFKDYMQGVKSFAITSTGYQSSQQNTILGLASFFDHKEEISIGIISDNIHNGSFKDIISISKKRKLPIHNDALECEVHSFYNHFDFIDLNQLLAFSNDRGIDDYDEVFDNVVDYYDIVFWDVPELHKIQLDSEAYFPVIMKFESLSIIVAQSLSSSKDIDDIRTFFLGYGINLKGLILDNPVENEVKEKSLTDDKLEKGRDESQSKKPWWRIFG